VGVYQYVVHAAHHGLVKQVRPRGINNVAENIVAPYETKRNNQPARLKDDTKMFVSTAPHHPKPKKLTNPQTAPLIAWCKKQCPQ
jgi:hypothetical protein